MVRRLLQARHSVAVHDLRKEAASGLLESGASWADTPRAAASGCELVFTSLPGPAEVESVLLDPQAGILAGLAPGACYVDTTTNSPAVFRRLAEECRKRGIEVLDAPVSGGRQGAVAGTLAVMVGGSAATLERVRPVLEILGSNLVHVGDISAGMTAKLVVQHLVHAHLLSDAEGMLLGVKAGLDPRRLLAVLQSSSASSGTMDVFPRLVFDGQFSAPATFEGVLKDLGLVRELATQIELETPVLDQVQGVLERGRGLGCDEAGFLANVRTMEQLAGCELRDRKLA